MKIKPIADYVVVEPKKRENKTKSGIVLPDTVEKEKPQEGVVVAVGAGRLLENGKHAPMQVQVGEMVLFSKYGPTEIKIDGKEYYVIKEEDILAVIK